MTVSCNTKSPYIFERLSLLTLSWFITKATSSRTAFNAPSSFRKLPDSLLTFPLISPLRVTDPDRPLRNSNLSISSKPKRFTAQSTSIFNSGVLILLTVALAYIFPSVNCAVNSWISNIPSLKSLSLPLVAYIRNEMPVTSLFTGLILNPRSVASPFTRTTGSCSPPIFP